MKKKLSRRDFIAKTGYYTLASSTLLSSLGGFQKALAAANTSGYKALVCLHLGGGNNGHNFIVPMTEPAYTTYAMGRNDLAIPKASLLPLGTTGYGIHPSCTELQGLFNSNNMAVVCNVGTLISPVTLAQAKAGSIPIPSQLFAHNDQTSQFLSGQANSVSGLGWGGKISDLLVNQGVQSKLSFNINASNGANVWQVGSNSTPYFFGTGGATYLNSINYAGYSGGSRKQATLDLMTQAGTSANPLVRQYNATLNSSISKSGTINAALAAAGDFKTVFPGVAPADGLQGDSQLSLQLHQVARIIKAQSQIGDSRQLFFIELQGFDTHQNELATQKSLLGYLSQYLQVFQNAMVEIGMQNNVTLFTTSDFGRTLTSNNGGADHGWGNHHIVLGGAVQGGKLYGTFPDLTIGGANDFGLGRLLPTTSADQVAGTLAQWFGVSGSDLKSIFPNLSNFPVTNMGFMG